MAGLLNTFDIAVSFFYGMILFMINFLLGVKSEILLECGAEIIKICLVPYMRHSPVLRRKGSRANLSLQNLYCSIQMFAMLLGWLTVVVL